MPIIIFFSVIFISLVLLSIPVAFSLGTASIFVYYLSGQPLGNIPMRIWTGLDKFSLIAIPFFILAGELMSTSGILERLMDFARLIIGRLKGGLLYINILVSMIFGGINGSAVADSSAVGCLLIPSSIDEYGDKELAASVTASSSVVGPIIPPSLPMLIYAFAAGNVSVAGLFLSGIVPGILLGVGMMISTYFMIKNKNYPRIDVDYSTKEILRIIRRFILAAVLPIIIVGGIVGGIFTPTEAGCIAVFYALFIGFFITKELTFKKVYKNLIRSTIVSSIVLIMIAVANVVTWWLSIQGVPQIISNFFQQITSSTNIFLFLMIILYLFVGLFIEAAAAIIMLVPVFLPVAMTYGVHPLQFGILTVLGLLIGLVTPPVGLCLSIASSIAKTEIEKVFIKNLPLLAVQFGVLLIVAYFPELYLWVPRLFGFG
ncbi:TRAP transporter large permease [Halanaerobium sp. Z-7514]|uniref:TRAP transporter large permease n=1 Tax=Halanaerobium polyolivorans TaxID=2886943 RepID=A0AAW4X1Z6_9FIRM|nr:TRAP transporter large permease [Halanaerobium polyolivorans]MCC3145778.1 TRAP transporter large permease [Halanaerobium polyolivorans]